MHYTPGVTPDAGAVAYLLSAGAAVDVVGLRSWELPSATLAEAVREHPRNGFKNVFTEAFRREAARVLEGRAQLLLRYGAFAAAIRFARSPSSRQRSSPRRPTGRPVDLTSRSSTIHPFSTAGGLEVSP